jgi:TRAP-type mannitol/chloroaromatic compound transport system substrate-binding protein
MRIPYSLLYRGAGARREVSGNVAGQACRGPPAGGSFGLRSPNVAAISAMMPGGEVCLRPMRSGPCAMAMVRLSAFAAAAAVALMAASARAQVQWSLPSAYPADNFHSENLGAFAQDVTDVTAGRLAIKVYPNASLFPATAIKSAVRIGQAQVGEVLISLHDNEDPMFGIDVVPFLAASYDEARKLWAASKPAIERKFAAQGLMVLFAVPWQPQGI